MGAPVISRDNSREMGLPHKTRDMGLPDKSGFQIFGGFFYGIWAQGISIKITIQEINTHHRINGGFNFHWETQLYIYVPLPCLIAPGYIQR
jgi:hypothetical protein